METKLNKLFEYFDELFLEEKVEIDNSGRMGLHYDGLVLDEYLESSVLGIDYLSIEDYFDSKAQVKFYEGNSLFNQYSEEHLDTKLKVISAILSLVNISNYRANQKEQIIKKSVAFLGRFGFKVIKDLDEIIIINEKKKFEGSYSNIFEYNEQFYKKQLKDKYKEEDKWTKRFKYEYENMLKLSESPYVLKVFNYDDDEHSYLMEKCDCNLDDYISLNPTLKDEKMLEIIFELVLGMKDVHHAGIIHRDLHLGNILIKDGHIILSDFGLSKDAMIKHSLKSSSTPKNSHYFMDPVCFSDFTLLDKLSDIYSIGKIIDYITKDRIINEKLSYVISKSTNRDKNKRYQRFEDFYDDIESSVKEVEYEDKIKKIELDIRKGIMSPGVDDFIKKLTAQEQLSTYIVKNQIYDFWKLVLQFNEIDQMLILNEIEDTYSEATGYGHFENYDLFASIMYNIIKKTDKTNVRRIAHNILEGCSKYRYKANDYLKEVDTMFFNI